MSTASAAAPALMTAEEFGERPDPGHPEELVRGRIVPMPQPMPRHGQICFQAGYLLRRFLDNHDLGHVLSNDSGVITERGPDTVRSADVVYYSYARVPKGPLPNHYLETPPDLVIEVMSPSDRWPKVLAKVAEYLNAGATAVVVLDDEKREVHLYRSDRGPVLFRNDDELSIPELLAGFRVKVSRFFE